MTNKLNMKTIYVMISILLLSVAIDQITKLAAEKYLMISSHESELTQYEGDRILVGSLGVEGQGSFLSLSLNYVRNLGAAWGVLSDLPHNIRNPFFFLVTLVAIIFILVNLRSLPNERKLARWAFLLILSGAIGNFLNRLTHGYVIDWIDVRWNFLGWRYNFPNFNWADCMISISVALLLVDMIFIEPRSRVKPQESQEV